MAKFIVPKSGAESISDNLVGFQITDGKSLFTNTNFTITNLPLQINEEVNVTTDFSEPFDYSSLEKSTLSTKQLQKIRESDNRLRFFNKLENGSVSLYGSLTSRIFVTIKNIVENFPSAFFINSQSLFNSFNTTAYNIQYDSILNRTTFRCFNGMVENPHAIVFNPRFRNKNNELRNFFINYTKYNVICENQVFPIYSFSSVENELIFTVNGNFYGDDTQVNFDILVKPNDSEIYTFFKSSDELTSLLLNENTSPKYKSKFTYFVEDSLDGKYVEQSKEFIWPLYNDGYNIVFDGVQFNEFLSNISETVENIDRFKSNLIVRFLTSPQLYEFDTESKNIEKIFQIYGQSFDKTKKLIDNIKYLRNLSYDGVNNLPDILLKNFANVLGLENLDKITDDVFLKSTLFKDESADITNLLNTKKQKEILINLAYLYKSKGTRKVIDFLFGFIGIPTEMTEISEMVYYVSDVPFFNDLQKEVFDVVSLNQTAFNITFDENTYEHQINTTPININYDLSGYPINNLTRLPQTINTKNQDIYFAYGGGWFERNQKHKTEKIIDSLNTTSEIKFRYKPFSYGEEYFDLYRKLPGMNKGFELTPLYLDQKIISDNTDDLLNTKRLNVFISPSKILNYNIWKTSREQELTYGTNSLPPQIGVSFPEFLVKTISKMIENSNNVKYRKIYASLEDVYKGYLKTNNKPYRIEKIREYVDILAPYWVEFTSQFIPSTTHLLAGNLVNNNYFGRPKYQYRVGCYIKSFIEEIGSLSSINQEITDVLSDESFCGVTIKAIVTIDGKTINTNNQLVLNKPNTEINMVQLVSLLVSTFNQINNNEQRLRPGYLNEYLPFIYNATNRPVGFVKKPVFTFEFFMKDEKLFIKIKNIKYGNNECTINKSFDVNFIVEGFICQPDCGFDINLGEITLYCNFDLNLEYVGIYNPV